MRTDKQTDGDDPWLTVAEVAEELRLNPATIRLWISKGQLIAVRTGPRRLLIKRSDLDRTISVLRGERSWLEDVSTKNGPWQVRQLPPTSRDRLVAKEPVEWAPDAAEVNDVLEGLKRADEAWHGSQAASENAPPDPGFSHRLLALAEACEMQRYWLSRTSGTSSFEWKPIGDGSNLQISHELREGAIRPGPQRLWDQFDVAVGVLGHALAHGPLGSVVRAYDELSGVMNQIATELLGGEPPETRETL
ncbi:MAG: helix-turn-helix domain-containing protein [Solirubrobacteraceae bacterium]